VQPQPPDQIVTPPSTMMACAVTNEPALEARKTAAPAIWMSVTAPPSASSRARVTRRNAKR
jgi:hypothetical protein